MNAFTSTLLSACLTVAASGAMAQDAVKKNDAMAIDSMMEKDGAASAPRMKK